MFHGDVIDQLHENDGLADTGAAEQADLSAAGIRSEEVDDFDTGLEGLNFGFLIDEFRSRAVNRIGFFRVDWPLFIHRLADDVQHAPQRFLTDRYGNTGRQCPSHPYREPILRSYPWQCNGRYFHPSAAPLPE